MKMTASIGIRKTAVKKLQMAGISNNKIACITGHNGEKCVRDYSSTDKSNLQYS